MAPFAATAYYNEYLAENGDTVWVVVAVKASETLRRTVDRAEVIIIDNSGSMGSERKMEAAKQAARAAVDALDDGVEFAVVTGNDVATKVWPRGAGSLVAADQASRAGAHAAVASVQPTGATRIGNWLDLARRLFEGSSAGLRHAILLSDGRNTAGDEHLRAAIEACRDVFHCDCRGFGTDWSVAELREVAEALGGQVRLVDRLDEVGREELAEHLRRLVQDSQARAAPGVRLRIVTRTTSDVVDFLQSAPDTVEMADRGEPVESGPRATEFPLGAWAPGERRDYTFAVKVRHDEVGNVGSTKPVAKAELVLADGTVASECVIKVVWTDDPELSTRVEPAVAHHREQREGRDELRAGLAAKAAGEKERAAILLWRARERAWAAGNVSLVDLVDKLVYLDDTGTPHLLDSSVADVIHVDSESGTSTTFPGPVEDDGAGGEGDDDDQGNQDV